MTKEVISKMETSYQRRVQFPFRSPVTKEEGKKICHNEKKETSDQKRVPFTILSSFTKARKPKNVVIGKIATLGLRMAQFPN